MSRFSDDYEPRDDGKNTAGLWRANVKRALASARGKAALRDLRDALLALPQKRLIEGALCTVGLDDRIAAMPATKTIETRPYRPDADGRPMRDEAGRVIFEPLQPREVKNWDRQSLIDFAEEHQGDREGVCAIGAYVWWRKVKAGMDPAAAFAALPVLPDTDGGEWETADAGQEAGLTATLAWELAYMNDERLGGLPAEKRYERFMAWIDTQLGGEA